ncbi:Ligand-gated ion channel 4 [Aphelenchoides besseyi]|nr:Ligand-gated ion channel 4 [Aphelenchoides besseyi]
MLWWYLILACSLQLAKSDETLVRLYRTILRDYNNNIRPSIRHNMPVNVTFSFALTQIIDVDERKEILTSNAWIRQTWIDYRLIWSPLEHNNLTFIHVPFSKVWKPDIILYNNAASEYAKSLFSTDVIVTYDGNVSWTMAAIMQSSCGMDVRYYPFETQFASWAYDGTKIDIVLSSSIGDVSNYMTSTEWDLKHIRAEKNSIVYSCCPEPYPFVDIHIKIQRRPMFYVFNLILPCVMISSIALLGFYMPSGAGEKVSLGITSLLSTTVFLMLVADEMPPTSDALPLLGIYYGATIFIVALATASAVLTLNVHHHGQTGKSVPMIIQKVAFGYLARFLFVRTGYYHSINEHVEYMYMKDHSGQDDREDRFHSLWLNSKMPTNANTVSTSELSSLSSPTKKEHNAVNKRVSFTSDVPNGNARNGGGSMKTTSRSNHISVETKRARGIDETALITMNSILPLAAAVCPPSMLNSGDLFESEFLRVLGLWIQIKHNREVVISAKVHAAMERNEMRLAEKDRRNACRLEWQQVALVLDRFLFLLFGLGSALTFFVIIYQKELAQFLGL